MLYDFSIDGDLLRIEEDEFQIIADDPKILIFDKDFRFLPMTAYKEIKGFVYELGGRWYIQDIDVKECQMKELKYYGKAVQKLPTKAFLGIHSGYELLKGVGLYSEWIEKAKYLGIETLGICEKNTLAGVIAFKNICNKNEIKPITGMSFDVQNENDTHYVLKAYVKNFEGWQNLLHFSALLNVDGKLFVDEVEVLKHTEGLIFVMDPKSLPFEEYPAFAEYYQIDTVKFTSDDTDKWYADNLERFITSDLMPLPIVDAYYIEQSDFEAREILWGIGKSYEEKSSNQFFKNNDQYASELIQLFEPGCKTWVPIYGVMKENLDYVIEECKWEYDTENRRLPRYKMTKEESLKFKTNEELFLHLIKIGFKEKKIDNPNEYIDRLKEEIRVLKKGDVIDYFLVLYDIISYAKRENILVGIGRGSAGGSLVSWLLGIIQINPIEFNLLFERFLNDGRMGFMADCKAWKINDELTLNEGAILKVKRDKKEVIIFVEQLKEGDEILTYN